jgi:hypothetical protein
VLVERHIPVRVEQLETMLLFGRMPGTVMEEPLD